MVTWQSGNVEYPSSFFESCCASSRVSIALIRDENVDLPEPRRRTSMADRVDLRGLALGIAGEPELLPIRLPGRAVAGLPEVGRAALIRHARNHVALLAVLDFPKRVAAELEVVALLVDRIIPLAVDQHSVV